MSIKLDWLGCATFRLLIDDLTIFLDTYIDKVSAAPNVGISTAEIKNADFIFIGHSHFDQMLLPKIQGQKSSVLMKVYEH